jgi:hypothetical protein
MEKEFVPYEIAIQLKELGFDEPCFATWNGETLDMSLQIPSDDYFTKAPTFSQCFKFFREKHNWQHSIEPTADQHSHQLGYNYWIWNYKTGEEHHTMPKNRPTGDWEYETYEEAELACLDKLIEIVKTK